MDLMKKNRIIEIIVNAIVTIASVLLGTNI